MNQKNLIKSGKHEILIVFLHVLVIFFLIASQTLSILSIGASISWKGCCTFILQIAVYFLCHYWVIPKMFNKKDLPVFFLRLCLLVASDILARGIITFSRNSTIGFWQFLLSFEQLVFASVQLSIVFGLSFFMGLYRHNEHLRQKSFIAEQATLKAETQKAKIEAEKAKAESTLAHMRLNSHLLFNTLNYVRLKAGDVIPDLDKAIDLLARIMLHSMVDVAEAKKIPLAKEIARVKDEIELHRLLADGQIYIDFKERYSDMNNDLIIPPAMLLTFVENIFRYGILKDPDYPSCVSIQTQYSQITFSTFNYKRNNSHHGTGLGITSVKSMLAYFYPGSHHLEIEETEDTYHLALTIDL